MAEDKKKLTVENVGAVRFAEIPIDPDGGITILRGDNGAGKDTTLDAVAAAMGDKAKAADLGPTDGVDRGRIAGMGVKVTFGKRVGRSGHLEATGLAGRFDLSAFVEPGIKDGVAADAARVKSLLAIRQVGPDVDRFSGLVDIGQMGSPLVDQVLRSDDVKTAPDLVEQARRVKVGLEREARRCEQDSIEKLAEVAGLRQGLDDDQLTGESNPGLLNAALERAIAERAEVNERVRLAMVEGERREKARAKLDQLTAGDHLRVGYVSVADATAALTVAQNKMVDAGAAVERLAQELAKAKEQLAASQTVYDRSRDKVDAATEREELIREAREFLSTQPAAAVTDEEVDRVHKAVHKARELCERGALIRAAQDARAQVEELRGQADQSGHVANTCRKAAADVDRILSAAVNSDSVWVDLGRLYVDHPKRGKTLFADLSKGESWRIAVLEAIAVVRHLHAEGAAIIVIPQHAWEGLQPKVRRELYDIARDEQVTILTAEAADGPLSAEVWKGGA